MKNFLTGVALIAGTVAAQAADMPAKAPFVKAPIVQVYDWTGFYIGVNGGVSVGRDRTVLVSPGAADRSNLSPSARLAAARSGTTGKSARIG